MVQSVSNKGTCYIHHPDEQHTHGGVCRPYVGHSCLDQVSCFFPYIAQSSHLSVARDTISGQFSV